MKDKFHFLCRPARCIAWQKRIQQQVVYNQGWSQCSSERCLVRFRANRKLNKITTMKEGGVNKPNITRQQEVVLMSDDEQGVIDPVVRWE